jgi:hypothetical protein
MLSGDFEEGWEISQSLEELGPEIFLLTEKIVTM